MAFIIVRDSLILIFKELAGIPSVFRDSVIGREERYIKMLKRKGNFQTPFPRKVERTATRYTGFKATCQTIYAFVKEFLKHFLRDIISAIDEICVARGELKVVGDHTAAGVSLCAFISQGARRSLPMSYV